MLRLVLLVVVVLLVLNVLVKCHWQCSASAISSSYFHCQWHGARGGVGILVCHDDATAGATGSGSPTRSLALRRHCAASAGGLGQLQVELATQAGTAVSVTALAVTRLGWALKLSPADQVIFSAIEIELGS